ncbi:transcriptional regulator [Haloprofundus sp. MHR1]|uniref:transcriptional regulator n=1 Tax=Haloprofundus sp. MHR1 TaxID=2572921 RepID=UPI0010BF62A7|nr:transcriptional regulator [Haloprofundus sp. MHR1]QCJ46352.1 transcriptional regulator [Haloprofundus sp. MHR1]
MADLNPIAKRIHNVSPEPVRLTLSDGSSAVYHFSGTQFFQREFQGEGTCEDDDADYRLITSEDNESVLLGRKGPDDDGWSMVGEVVEAERTERVE